MARYVEGYRGELREERLKSSPTGRRHVRGDLSQIQEGCTRTRERERFGSSGRKGEPLTWFGAFAANKDYRTRLADALERHRSVALNKWKRRRY